MIFFSKNSQEKGFTIVELMVAVAIIFITSGIAAANYRHGDRQAALNNQAFQLMQDIRRVQELALSSREVDGVAPSAYGIYFSKDNNYYSIYADKNGNQEYNVGEEVESVLMNTVIEISDIQVMKNNEDWTSRDVVDINYAAPDLTARIIKGTDKYVAAKITFRIVGGSQTRAVVANIAGLVYVE